MNSIEAIQDEIIEEFSLFEDWMQRYEYMIELGKSLPLIDQVYKTDSYVIKGCQSKVWVHAAFEKEKLKFIKKCQVLHCPAITTSSTNF